MIREMALCPTAPPTAWADIFAGPFRDAASCGALPLRIAIMSAISPYVIVCPKGMVSRISHTALRNGLVSIFSGGVKSGALPPK